MRIMAPYRLPCSGRERSAGRAATSTLRSSRAADASRDRQTSKEKHKRFRHFFRYTTLLADARLFLKRTFGSKEGFYERTGPVVDQCAAVSRGRRRTEGKQRAPGRAAGRFADRLPAVSQVHAPQPEAFQVDQSR